MKLTYLQDSSNAYTVFDENKREVCSLIFNEEDGLEQKEALEFARLFSISPKMKEGILEALEFLQGIPEPTKEAFELIKKLGFIISDFE